MVKPWREIIVPHKDVAEGRYQQAEFAADLAQVLSGNAESEYQDPVEFFDRTYLTEGMKLLLVSTLRRASRVNGEPVIQLKTAFGGGKTHTMLAIYHMFKGKSKVKNHQTVKEVLSFAGAEEIPTAKIAVLVGTAMDPSKSGSLTTDGIMVNTLWGEMAYQIGGQEGYALVKEADKRSVAPGANTIVELFDTFGPCIVLIDELVAYARNIYGKNGLIGGSFESVMTFVQNLTEAAKRSKHSMVIAAIPESNIEIGGEGGQAALARIENTFGRLEAIWKPVKANESFEIVRRRLFEPVRDEKGRDEVCEAFSRMYLMSSADFPQECKEKQYLERLKKGYPIHPEVFDRLYSDWSTLERFQRTRGVLRLMAATIHQLWINGDTSLLIMPGSIPLDSARIKDELTRYLTDEWNSIVDVDVDGEMSEPRRIDATNKRFGQTSAARRVARTIFLGSAPSSKEQRNRGIEDVRIILGIVQPNEQLSTYKDALSTLSQKLTYLYYQGNRYWYDSHPNLRKTVEDRAGRLDQEEVNSEINDRLNSFKDCADFSGVHVYSEKEDIPDEDEVRLIVLPLSAPYRKSEPGAINEAKNILDMRGNIPRKYKNMLLFLAPDENAIALLEEGVRHFIAWRSVVDDQEPLNLDGHQRRQADESLKKSDKTVSHRLNAAYCWLLVPTQDSTNQLKLDAVKITEGEGSFIEKASKQARNDELLITKWSPALLKNELDKWLWKESNNIPLKKLWDYFASYPYLPRLKDSSVLLQCIKDGLRSRDFFAYAINIEPSGKYQGLEFGNPGANVTIDSISVLVKKESALKQVEEDKQKASQQATLGTDLTTDTSRSEAITETTETTEISDKKTFKQFNGIVDLEPTRLSRDADKIAEEVIKHLAILPNAQIRVSLEINFTSDKAIPEKTAFIVLENCKALKFRVSDFEE